LSSVGQNTQDSEENCLPCLLNMSYLHQRLQNQYTYLYAYTPRGQFLQRSTSSFFEQRSWMRKKTVMSAVLIGAFRTYKHKSCTKNVDEIDTSSVCDTIKRQSFFSVTKQNRGRSIGTLFEIIELVLCFGSPNSDNKMRPSGVVFRNSHNSIRCMYDDKRTTNLNQLTYFDSLIGLLSFFDWKGLIAIVFFSYSTYNIQYNYKKLIWA